MQLSHPNFKEEREKWWVLLLKKEGVVMEMHPRISWRTPRDKSYISLRIFIWMIHFFLRFGWNGVGKDRISLVIETFGFEGNKKK